MRNLSKLFALIYALTILLPAARAQQTATVNYAWANFVQTPANVTRFALYPLPPPAGFTWGTNIYLPQPFFASRATTPLMTNGYLTVSNVTVGVGYSFSISDLYNTYWYTNYFPTNDAGQTVYANQRLGFFAGPYWVQLVTTNQTFATNFIAFYNFYTNVLNTTNYFFTTNVLNAGLAAGSGITITTNGTVVTIAATGGGSGTPLGVGYGLTNQPAGGSNIVSVLPMTFDPYNAALNATQQLAQQLIPLAWLYTNTVISVGGGITATSANANNVLTIALNNTNPFTAQNAATLAGALQANPQSMTTLLVSGAGLTNFNGTYVTNASGSYPQFFTAVFTNTVNTNLFIGQAFSTWFIASNSLTYPYYNGGNSSLGYPYGVYNTNNLSQAGVTNATVVGAPAFQNGASFTNLVAADTNGAAAAVQSYLSSICMTNNDTRQFTFSGGGWQFSGPAFQIGNIGSGIFWYGTYLTTVGSAYFSGNGSGLTGIPLSALVGLSVISNNAPTIQTFTANTNGYAEVLAWNQSSGSSASSDFTAQANNGSINSFYMNIGMNSSGYTAAGPAGTNTAYILAVGNAGNTNGGTTVNLFEGAAQTNSSIYWSVGNGLTATNMSLSTNGLQLNIGQFTGNGAGLTGLNGSSLTGPVAATDTSNATNSWFQYLTSTTNIPAQNTVNFILTNSPYTFTLTGTPSRPAYYRVSGVMEITQTNVQAAAATLALTNSAGDLWKGQWNTIGAGLNAYYGTPFNQYNNSAAPTEILRFQFVNVTSATNFLCSFNFIATTTATNTYNWIYYRQNGVNYFLTTNSVVTVERLPK